MTDMAATSKSPLDRHYEELEEFVKLGTDVLGQMMIRGVDGVNEDTEDHIDPNTLTEEQVQAFRHVVITKDRETELNNMRRLILGKQADQQFAMFNTSFSHDVLQTWYVVKRSLASMKDPSKKLDRLFAYSYNLFQLDAWMHDNEGNMRELVEGLAGAWKSLLNNHSDEKLGWDCKYTKPGMLAFLDQFENKIDDMPDYFNLGEFDFEGYDLE